MPKLFTFPNRYTKGVTTTANHLAIVGPATAWPGERPFAGKPKDGMSETILLAENDGLGVHWMEPRDLEFDTMSFNLESPRGISSPYRTPAVATVDATIRSFTEGIDPEAVRAMATANGGETIREEGGAWRVIEDGRQRELK
jgi:hypothetical protein